MLTDDFESARPLRTEAALRPATPARAPASSDGAEADLSGNERSASATILLGGAAAGRELPIARVAREGGGAGGARPRGPRPGPT